MNNVLKNRRMLSYSLFSMVGFFFICIFYSVFTGEHNLAVNGLGWDGVNYTQYTKNFYNLIVHHEASYYRVQRIFPLSLVYLASVLFRFPITEANAVLLFSLLNASMLIVAAITWMKLAKLLEWNLSVRIISFAGLFFNLVNMKMSIYYPALTDTTAFALGLLMLYFYLNKNINYLLLITFIGSFTFPTLLYAGLILFLFPVNDETHGKYKIQPILPKTNLFIVFLQGSIITLLCMHIQRQHDWLGAAKAVGGIYTQPIFFFSATALLFYLISAFFPLSKYYLTLLLNLKKLLRLKRVIISIFLFLLVKFLVKFISSPDAVSVLSTWEYILHVAGQSLAYPFVYLISHVIYFGPIVCLLVCFWREAVDKLITERAIGLFFLTAIYTLLSIGSESRQLINFLPVVVYIVGEALNKRQLTQRFVFNFVFMSLLISKFWLPINHASEWPSLLTNPPEVTLEFPMQWFFMNFGPWFSSTSYVINGCIALTSFIIVFLMIKVKSHSLDAVKSFENGHEKLQMQ